MAVFNESAGLCVSPCGKRLYVCNTNNHSIDVVDLANSIVEPLKLHFDDKPVQSLAIPILTTSKLVIHTSGAKIHLKFELICKTDIKFTENAPQKWQLDTINDQWEVVHASGDVNKKPNGADSKNNNGQRSETIGYASVDLIALSLKNDQAPINALCITFKVNLCDEKNGICFPKKFQVKLPIETSVDGANSIERQTWVTVNEKTAELLAGNSLIVK